MNVVFGDDPPGSHRQWLALNRQDAVNEHQRFVGKTNPRGMLVDLGKHRSQTITDLADGKRHALVTVEGSRRGGSLDEGQGLRSLS